jgi:adenosylmethionine-8-amino-7-oxononanoate aminotransferase
LPQVDFIDLSADHAISSLEWLAKHLEKNPELYAGFIFEPLVQGAAGMLRIPAEALDAAIELCRKHEILTIGDEVFTGFYRTGKAFAFEYLRRAPDLLCLSKGITGGFLPLAVTLASERIFEAFLSAEIRKGFLHGHSYTANPIAYAAALESWRLLQEPECQARIEMVSRRTRFWTEKLKTHPRVNATRCLGTIGAIELRGSESYLEAHSSDSIPPPQTLTARALKKGVLLRPLGRVLYAVPPYCVTSEEVDLIYQTMGETIE